MKGQMVETATLGTRQSTVLRAVVTDYVRTAEPVGSSALASRHRLKVSPATVRNDMAALEDLGFLAQPHTSAGRIPTDLGYRFFVDTMPRRLRLSDAQRRVVGDAFRDPADDAQEALRRAAQVLSRLTRYGAVTTGVGVEHVFLGGTANIASEEAFERRETVRRLLETLEEEERMVGLLTALASSGEEVAVVIGHENPLAAMWEASVVVAPLRTHPAGAVAVIGPTRMQYPTAVSAARMVAGRVSGLIGRLAG
jgi:heat-inducible transcriptional repressor